MMSWWAHCFNFVYALSTTDDRQELPGAEWKERAKDKIKNKETRNEKRGGLIDNSSTLLWSTLKEGKSLTNQVTGTLQKTPGLSA